VKKYILIALLASGCGPHKVEVEQKTPIVVQHVVSVDVKQLTKYFDIVCLEDDPTLEGQDLQDCIDSHIAKFFNIIGGN
jgi:hypothetical protein